MASGPVVKLDTAHFCDMHQYETKNKRKKAGRKDGSVFKKDIKRASKKTKPIRLDGALTTNLQGPKAFSACQ